MDKVILCYTFSGNSMRFAKKLQSETGAQIVEVKEAKTRSRVNAFSKGIKQARAHEKVALAQELPDLSGCGSVTMVFPVWAGCAAPAFNSCVEALPEKATVTVYLISASGKSNDGSKEYIRRQVEERGCSLNKINDISSKSASK